MARRDRITENLVTQLPIPEPGVVDRIMDEILTNRALFVAKEFLAMSRENPLLKRRFSRDSMSSPSYELSTNWGLIYVVAHTRSGLLPEVEDPELLDGAVPHERVLVPRERNVIDMVPDSAARIRRFELFDEQRSPELAGFWRDVRALRQIGPAIVYPIDNLVYSLHTQAERNQREVEARKTRAITS